MSEQENIALNNSEQADGDNEVLPVSNGGLRLKKVFSWETLIFLVIFLGIFCGIGWKMGAVNMIKTMMSTSYQLLIGTVFDIMAVAVLAGAIAGLLTEFGVIAIINKLLSPIMKPIYGLPGAGIIGILTTYLSDNPAILSLADDNSFKRYFKKYQMPALTNLGTAFGMGLIVTTFLMAIPDPNGGNFVVAALIGNIGAIIGSIVSVRLMLIFSKKEFGTIENACEVGEGDGKLRDNLRIIRTGSGPSRALSAILDGGKSGVEVGLSVIPGVLIICTLVMMLTGDPSANGTYTGAAFEGVGLFPWIGEKLNFILKPLFGFSSSQALAVPITALGAAGAAIGVVPKLVASGLAGARDIAVFTAMCMCWSGYLSTHVAMMSALKFPKMTGKSIICHTVGGLVAGVTANWLFVLVSNFVKI